MSLSWTAAAGWLLHCAVGGGLLLLVTCAVMARTPQPVRRQRLGECGLAAALVLALLSLGPSWLIVEYPTAGVPSADAPPAPAFPAEMVFAWEVDPADPGGVPELPDVAPAVGPPGAAPHEASAAPWWRPVLAALLPGLVVAYALSALYLVGRWLLGHAVLGRLLRSAGPAPAAVERLFDALVEGRRRPRLLVSSRLRVPISCGLLRPTVLLPAAMCDPPDLQKLRWVFAHELTHLERRDAWSAVLFAVGQAVYFFVPWFRWLRRQVRLCQEFIADSAAVCQAADQSLVRGGDEPADYVEFLLTLSGAPPAPAAASAVSGSCSDLYRRVSMLLQKPQPVERRCPRRWSLAAAGGLFALAVLVGGIGVRAEAAPQVVVVTGDDKEVQQAGQKVRVVVVPGGQAEKPAAGFFLKRVVPQPVFEKRVIVIQRKPGEVGEEVLVQGAGADPAQVEALRKALEILEKQGGKPDVEALQQRVREALEKLKGAGGDRRARIVEIGEGRGIDIGEDRGIDVKGVVKLAHPALPGLRKALEELNQRAGQPGVDEARHALKQAIEKLEAGGVPGVIGLKGVPGVGPLEIEIGPGGAGAQVWRFQPAHKADAEALKKLREELKKLPNADELLKALDAWEKARQKAHALPMLPPQAALFWRDRGATGHGRLGVQVEKPAAILADQLNLPKGNGLVVTTVKADSPAAKAGLKVNDVLLEVGGKAVPDDAGEFARQLDKLDAKDAVDAVVLRKGKRETVRGIQLAAGGQARVGWQVVPRAGVKVAPPVMAFPPVAVAKGQPGVMVTLFRTGDGFTARYQEGSLIINVTGKAADGKPRATQIHVQDGQVSNTYDTLERVPAQYRDKVNHLLDVTARGQIRVETK